MSGFSANAFFRLPRSAHTSGSRRGSACPGSSRRTPVERARRVVEQEECPLEVHACGEERFVLRPQLFSGAIELDQGPVDRERNVAHLIEKAYGTALSDALECVPNDSLALGPLPAESVRELGELGELAEVCVSLYAHDTPGVRCGYGITRRSTPRYST